MSAGAATPPDAAARVDVPVFAMGDPAADGSVARDFAARGAAVLGPPALRPELYAALLDEARTQLNASAWQLYGERRQGEIAQDSRRAHLGPSARGYLASPAVEALLRAATGRRLVPSWTASCYTAYVGPGQHMGEHCDKADACAFGLLTYLEARWPPQAAPGPGLQLLVFRGDNSGTGLSLRVTTHSNRCVVLNGARQAHLRPALDRGESMLMLAGCFRLDR